MHIRMGWSGETSSNTWQKIDVALEQEDLHRILIENDLPTELIDKLPTKVLFQLLQNEAEFLLLNKLKTMGYPPDKATAKQAVALESSQQIITAIKNQLTPA